MSKCEVCKQRESLGVACVPGVPISVAYCKECLQANAHPYDIMVSGTAMNGGLKECADWWQLMVTNTLDHLDKTEDEFQQDVTTTIADIITNN